MQHNNSSSQIIATTRGANDKYQNNNDKKFFKPLPPFGKEAAFLLSRGVQPRNDIFVFAGLNAWDKAKLFQNNQVILCLPYGTDPSNYLWPVKNCPVLLIDTGFLSIPDIEKLAYCLLCAEATILRVLLSCDKLMVYQGDAT